MLIMSFFFLNNDYDGMCGVFLNCVSFFLIGKIRWISICFLNLKNNKY